LANEDIGRLSFDPALGQDHEVVGVTNEPETGPSHFDVKAVEVDVGKKG